MAIKDNSDKHSKTSQKLEEFRLKHSDMESELKRRLVMLKMKNLKLLLKQAE
ncbi:MAG: hypothetical protein K2X86_08910 [Cytophagaceae bacterium]|nr:hypothetical protein [Cytophagaceae bacterium]